MFGNTEIQASDLSQYYKKLNEIGETETTNIEEQFKVSSFIEKGEIDWLMDWLIGWLIVILCRVTQTKGSPVVLSLMQ